MILKSFFPFFLNQGCYEFADGSKYEGEWKDHRMHGEGTYTDIDGNKWQGNYTAKNL